MSVDDNSFARKLTYVRIMLWITTTCASLCAFNLMGLWHISRVLWKIMDDTFLSTLISISYMRQLHLLEHEVRKYNLVCAAVSYCLGWLAFTTLAVLLERWVNARVHTSQCDESANIMMILSNILWGCVFIQVVTTSACTITYMFVVYLCQDVRVHSLRNNNDSLRTSHEAPISFEEIMNTPADSTPIRYSGPTIPIVCGQIV